jgi:hypothetical protein
VPVGCATFPFGNLDPRLREALGHRRVTVERVLNIRKTAFLAFAMRAAWLGDAGGRAQRGLAEAGECSICEQTR